MDASRSIGGDAFAWSLGAALRGLDVPHYLAVHAVDGVVPGLYRWPDLGRPVRPRAS